MQTAQHSADQLMTGIQHYLCAMLRCHSQGREGKVIQVYRRKWVIHVERITRDKVNGGCCICWLCLQEGTHTGRALDVTCVL